MGRLFNRLPACVAWLSNDVLACRGLAVAWLKRGANAHEVPGIRRARHGLAHEVKGPGGGVPVVVVMIGVDPHKASHTAVAINATEEPLGELRVRACTAQAEQLLAWARGWPDRTWAAGGADGVGHLLAQQLLAAGERVLDVQPKLSARVRLLAAGDTNKNDPNDARSVAIAALRSASRRMAAADDHAAVLRVWPRSPPRAVPGPRWCAGCMPCCELVPGGVSKKIAAGRAAAILGSITPADGVAAARRELAAEFVADLRRIGAQMRETRRKLAAAVKAPGTSLTKVFGVGPVIAAAVIGDVREASRSPGRDHFAAYNGTAPIEVPPGKRKVHRLSRRGNRRLNHAIHMAAVTQIRNPPARGASTSTRSWLRAKSANRPCAR